MSTTAVNLNLSSAPAPQGVADPTASLVAMISALIEMEGAIANVLGKNAELSIKVQDANAKAVATAGANALKQVEKAQEEADESNKWGIFGEIFGWVATALTSILSFGTLSIVAATAMTAATVAMQAGAFNSGPLGDILDKLAGGHEWAKDLISVGLAAGISLGAGAASEAMAAGVNAARSAAIEAGATAMDGQFSTVSKIVLAQTIIQYGPQVFQDIFEAMHLPADVAQGLAMTATVLISGLAIKSAFRSAGANMVKPVVGVPAAVVNRVRLMALLGDATTSLASSGFNVASGVYEYKRGLAIGEEAEPMATQEFLKDFSAIFNQQENRTSSETTQIMQNFRTINANFSQLMKPLQTAAQLLGSF